VTAVLGYEVWPFEPRARDLQSKCQQYFRSVRLEFGRIGETIEPENSRSGGMKYRIGMWASAGFLVAGGWALYAFATTPPAMTSADPILTLVEFTCPVVFASLHFHFSVSLYWSFLANASTYVLIGLILETMRPRLNQAK
jgi:hypothetical protein